MEKVKDYIYILKYFLKILLVIKLGFCNKERLKEKRHEEGKKKERKGKGEGKNKKGMKEGRKNVTHPNFNYFLFKTIWELNFFCFYIKISIHIH